VHSLRETGQGLDAYSQEADALRPLPGEVVNVALDDLIDEEANVEDVTQAGTVKVDLKGHNLAHFGTAFYDVGFAEIESAGSFDTAPEHELLAFQNETLSRTKVQPGSIDPSNSRQLGFFLSYETESPLGNPIVTVTISDNNGNFPSTAISRAAGGSIKIDAGPGPFEPEIEIESTLSPDRSVLVKDLTLELIDDEGNIAETIFNETQNEGVEPIEIERGAPPKGNVPRSELDSQAQPGNVLVPLRTYQNADLNIDADQPFLARIAIERAYRPTGIQSVEAEVFGLHGPEDMLLIDISTGQNEIRTAPFVCGQGRSVNLTTGTTRISDVEVPADILPTNVL